MFGLCCRLDLVCDEPRGRGVAGGRLLAPLASAAGPPRRLSVPARPCPPSPAGLATPGPCPGISLNDGISSCQFFRFSESWRLTRDLDLEGPGHTHTHTPLFHGWIKLFRCGLCPLGPTEAAPCSFSAQVHSPLVQSHTGAVKSAESAQPGHCHLAPRSPS